MLRMSLNTLCIKIKVWVLHLTLVLVDVLFTGHTEFGQLRQKILFETTDLVYIYVFGEQ